MRIRTVKPEFWIHPVMAKQSDQTRLLAIGLLNYADDEGYFYADSKLIRNALRPFDDDSGITTVSLRELSGIGYILLKTHPTHGEVGFIPSFLKHQVINKPKKSIIKELYEYGIATVSIPYQYGLEGKGMEGNGKDKNPSDSAQTSSVATWSEQDGFSIPDDVIARWEKAYPACDIQRQAAAANEWLIANPKRKKKNYHRFLSDWIARSQERGGDIPSNRVPLRPTQKQTTLSQMSVGFPSL